MSRPVSGVALRLVGRLFAEGSVAGLTDAQLLERFASDRDEAAFAALVDRHGPMVLAVCRSLLRDPGDADDAFQATFLALARRAGSFRARGDSLGGWLHRVAHRSAARASAEADRRRAVERRAAEAASRHATAPAAVAELREAVHREVGRLPERCRVPVVLHYLEGKTLEETALALRWGEKTVRRRLADARDLLRSRLSRSGIVPAAGLMGLLRPDRSSAAEALGRSAALGRAAACVAPAGAALGGLVALADGLVAAVTAARLKGALATSLAALAMVCPFSQGGATNDGGSSPPPRSPVPMPAGLSPAPGPAPVEGPPDDGRPADPVSIAGRVVGPDGSPVADAEVTVFQIGTSEEASPPNARRTRSGPDGAFRLDVDRSALRGLDAADVVPIDHPVLAASADGYGPAWARAAEPAGLDGLTLRLVEDDAPIRGRILDLEGRPVPGAVVRPIYIIAAEGEDLAPLLREGGDGNARGLLRYLDARVTGLPREVVAGEDGRFSLGGIGHDRVLLFTISGPTIAIEQLYAMTRPGPTAVIEDFRGPNTRQETFLGNPFEHVAAPAVPIVGVVRSAATGRPIPGVVLRGRGGNVLAEAESDAEGRYRLLGVPKGDEYRVAALPGDAPYVGASATAPGGPGLVPVTVDFDLWPGVTVRGRLVELGTGEPVRGVVTYHPYLDNPLAGSLTVLEPGNHWVEWNSARSADDGTFTLVVPPGHGLLTAQSASFSLTGRRYAPGHGADRVAGLGGTGSDPAMLPELPAVLPESLLEVDLPADRPAEPVVMEFDPGSTIPGVVIGPDDRPVPHARVSIREDGRTLHYTSADEAGRFRLAVTDAMAESGVMLVAMAEGFAPGFARAKPGVDDESEATTLRLATDDVPIEGRVLDLEGRPVAGATIRPRWVREPEAGDLTEWLEIARSGDIGAVELENRLLGKRCPAEDLGLPKGRTTDADGRFRIEGVGRERVVELEILGPGIRFANPRVATRAVEPFVLPSAAGSTDWGVIQYYGATFDHVAAPSRPIEGVVRDLDSGEPLPGVEVRSYQFAEFPVVGKTQLVATTDAEGRFLLHGMSPAPGNSVIALPPVDQPYLPSIVEVEAASGLDPARVEIGLKRGVWIEGRVTDAGTGEPIRDGFVQYGVFRDNPHFAECPGLEGAERWADFPLDAEGRYRVPGLPGRGAVGVIASRMEGYLTVKDLEGDDGRDEPLHVAPRWMPPNTFNAIAEVDIPEGTSPFRHDLTVTTGRTLEISVRDHDGRPITGYRVAGHWAYSNWTEPREEATFSLESLPRRGWKTLRFRHDGRGLAGILRVDLARGGPRVARLVPWGVAAGRLVDEDDRPRASVRLHVEASRDGTAIGSITGHGYGEQPQTDAEGRFRIEGLIPGLSHGIRVMENEAAIGRAIARDVTVGEGEARDLGDLSEEQR